MDKEYNPFTDCNVVATDQGWSVASKFWSFETKTKTAAIRAVEVIQAAYRNGMQDNQKSIKQVLGIYDGFD